MADKEGRVRLLRTLQILQNETDEQHPISIVQLENALMTRWEIPAFRITVQSDIAALRQAGHDIAVIKSTQTRRAEAPHRRGRVRQVHHRAEEPRPDRQARLAGARHRGGKPAAQHHPPRPHQGAQRKDL